VRRLLAAVGLLLVVGCSHDSRSKDALEAAHGACDGWHQPVDPDPARQNVFDSLATHEAWAAARMDSKWLPLAEALESYTVATVEGDGETRKQAVDAVNQVCDQFPFARVG
jgi:hypothetical protein